MSDQQKLEAIRMPFGELLGIKIVSAASERVTAQCAARMTRRFEWRALQVEWPCATHDRAEKRNGDHEQRQPEDRGERMEDAPTTAVR